MTRPMTRFARMRLHLVTPLVVAVALAAVLTACTDGDPAKDDAAGRAQAAEKSTVAVVGEAVPLAVRAVEGRDVRAEAGWTACMPGLSWKYDGAGVFDAPAGRVAAQLDAIRVALVDAGFRDVTEVEDQVAVERDDVTIAFSPQRATGDPEAWQVSFHTSCLKLSGDDKERAETGTRSPVAGLE